MARILIVALGLRQTNRHLQPWRYLLELGRGLVDGGHEVLFFGEETFTITFSDWTSRLDVKKRGARGRFGWRRLGFADCIRRENPDLVVFPVSRSMVFYRFLFETVGSPIVGVVTASPPNLTEILATRSSWMGRDLLEAGAILLDAIIPDRLVGHLLSRDVFRRFVALSTRSQEWLLSIGIPLAKVVVIPPGSDWSRPPGGTPEVTATQSRAACEDFLFRYFGSPAFSRGTDLLIQSFRLASRELNFIRLQCLLRIREDEGKLSEYADLLERMVRKKGLRGRVSFVHQDLSSEELRSMIQRADAVVLPFKVTQADCPLSVIEVLQSGVPLVTTPVDGIPDLVKDTDTLLIPPRERDLARALVALANRPRSGPRHSQERKNVPIFATWRVVRKKLATTIVAALHGGGY